MMLTITDAVPLFAGYTAARGLAPGTVNRHRKAAASFARACREGAAVGQIDRECITAWLAAHEGGQGARNNKLESLRAFLAWAHKSGHLGTAPDVLLDGFRYRKAERGPKHYLEAAEFPAALEAAGSHHPVDRMVTALALFTLARASEIAAVRLCDVDLAEHETRLYRDKRDRWTVTGMTPQLRGELASWLTVYAACMGYFSPYALMQAHPDWLLCPSRSRGGEFLQPERPIKFMERVAQRVLADLGVTEIKGEGMHTFRRSGARAFLKHLSEHHGHQRALVQVSLMLDHEDLKDTIRYIGVEQEKAELNDWLKGHEMYEAPPEPPGAAVIPLRALA